MESRGSAVYGFIGKYLILAHDKAAAIRRSCYSVEFSPAVHIKI